MFDIKNAKRRAASLGQLIGPIIVRGCGVNDLDGEVYYTELTVSDDRKLRVMERQYQDTYRYRELLLRAKDKDGDRIWEDDELPAVLEGSIDPMDVAYIVGSMYAGERYKLTSEVGSGPFDKSAARDLFESSNGLYGPVPIPFLGDENTPLNIWYRHGNGYEDCAVDAIRRKHPDDCEVRVLIKRALTEDGKPMFKNSHLADLATSITQKDMSKVMASMLHPRFMSDEERIRMSTAIEDNPTLDVDDLKN